MRLIAVMAVMLASCGADGAPQPPSGVEVSGVTPGDTCGASRYQGQIGIDRAAAYALVDDFAADGISSRVTGPGIATTRDFRPDRINIELNDDDIVVRLTCG